ncbi:hypothetical protein ACI78R_11540 [Geodermatophilus sp. SYSU D01106]
MVQIAQIAVLHRLVPRFFWLDDSQAQFGPMAWWLGRNAQGGVPPLADPDQGLGGNVTADMQYGSFDPLHWSLAWVLSRFDDVLTMAWVYGAVCMLLLGTGVLALALHHRVRPALAVAGALGVASSGFFLWYGSFWWPLMWGSAWLPWLWLGLSVRGARGVLLTGLATWAVLASGNPYSVPFAAVVVLAQLGEYRRRSGSWRELVRDRVARAQTGALAGGAVIALPTLLNGVQMAGWVDRQDPEPVLGNAGSAIPNLLDVVLGGPTLLGQTNAFNGPIGLVPATSTFLLAVPLLALVRWREALRRPGVPTALALTVAGVLATQLPTVVGLFRFPFRYLVVVQIALPLLALLAVTAARSTSRTRVALAAGLGLSQVVLAVLRAPALWPWHLAGLLLVSLALTALLVRVRATRRLVAAGAAAVLVLPSAAAVVVAERMMVDVQVRVTAERGLAGSPSLPYRDIGAPGFSGAEAMGRTVAEYRDRSLFTGRTVTVYAFGSFLGVFGPDRGWSAGFFAGNGNLLADARVGTGYVTSLHRGLGPVLCTSYVGSVGCPDTSRALATVPGTSRPWIDVLASDTVYLSEGAPEEVRAWFDREWDRGQGTGPWSVYERPADERHPGRVAEADGVEVADTGWTSDLARIGRPQDSYVVSTGDEPGTVLLRVPYWPGYRATVDGRPVEVRALEDALVQVSVPAGVRSGRLNVVFAPVGVRLLWPALAAGVVIVVLDASALWWVSRRRRAAHGPAAS